MESARDDCLAAFAAMNDNLRRQVAGIEDRQRRDFAHAALHEAWARAFARAVDAGEADGLLAPGLGASPFGD